MATYYRFYCITPDDHIVSVDDAHFDTDDEACEHARFLLTLRPRCIAVEVWNRDRYVGRVRADRRKAPASEPVD
jgi:hypothetical protein